MKLIKLMASSRCFPLWNMTPGVYGELDPRALPISEPLRRQLIEWAKVHDDTLDFEDPANYGFLTVDAKNAFEKEGMRLADQLRDELGPEFEVQLKMRAFVRAEKT